MASITDFSADGQLKIVTLSGSELEVQCSAINRYNGEDTSGLGWDRVGNTYRQRIVAATDGYSSNWRICVSIDKGTLRSLIKGPVIGVKLEVTPIQSLTCQPYNTQAALTSKYYTAASNELVELGWCTQGSIKNYSGGTRNGDIGLNFNNNGTKAVFGNGNMVSAQTPCVYRNGSYVDATHIGTNPGTFYYLFSDSTIMPDFLWGRAASNTRISYNQPTQSLSAMFNKVMDSDDDDDRVCFYLTRYMHAYKSSYGYAGWIYADYRDSFKVHIVYQNTVDVTIPLYINNHDVGPDASDLRFLWSPKSGTPSIRLVCNTPDESESTYLNYYPGTIYHLPFGSELSVLVDGYIAKNMFSVSGDSSIKEESGVYLDSSPITLPLRLNLHAGVTFVDPKMDSVDRPSYSTYAEIDGYFGQTRSLPLPPSFEKVGGNDGITHCPNTIYYNCSELQIDTGTSIENIYPRTYAVPDVYEEWKNEHKNDTALENSYLSLIRRISGVTYRKYRCNFIVKLPDGTEHAENDQSLTQPFTLKPSEIGGFPEVVTLFDAKMSTEYPGVGVHRYLTSVGGVEVNGIPKWDDILLYAGDVVDSYSNTPIEITIEAELGFTPSTMYCFYKDSGNNLYRAIYHDGKNAYQAVLKK